MISLSLKKTKNTETILKELEEKFGDIEIVFDCDLFVHIDINNDDVLGFVSFDLKIVHLMLKNNENCIDIDFSEMDVYYG